MEKKLDTFSDLGKTNVKGGLTYSVVALAAKEVSGVNRLCANFGFGFAKLFNKNIEKGVKIYNYKDGIVIDVSIWIDYGFSIADVSYRVQENIINAASSMLYKKIKAVNVKVLNVNVPLFEHKEEINKGIL